MRRSGKIERTCLECGSVFMTYRCQVRRGGGRFCSTSCGTRYRNRIDNPVRREEVRAKISANHADVSGASNPMFGKRGEDAPGYIDGRNSFSGDTWRKIALANKEACCEICRARPEGRHLHIHHRDRNRKNNDFSNLQILCVTCHNTVAHVRPRDDSGRFGKEVPRVADHH